MEPNCKCNLWATDNFEYLALTGHNIHCPDGPNTEQAVDMALEIIEELILGINIWASDEDGVHYKCWDAYRKANLLFGRVLPEDGEME